MTIFKRMMAATAVVIFGFTLYACGAGSSSAVTGTLTQAQFDSLLSTSSAFTSLKAQVDAIGSPAVYIKAPNAPTVTVNRRMTESVGGGSTSITAAALPSPCTWTLTGRPTSSDPLQSNIYSGVSCSGYYFNISSAPTASDSGILQQPDTTSGQITLYFDQPGCVGNPYIYGLSAAAMAQGAVMRVDATGADPTGVDPNTYYYLPPGSSPSPVATQSAMYKGSCTGLITTGGQYKLLPNDPTVTGVPSAPIPGPISIAN